MKSKGFSCLERYKNLGKDPVGTRFSPRTYCKMQEINPMQKIIFFLCLFSLFLFSCERKTSLILPPPIPDSPQAPQPIHTEKGVLRYFGPPDLLKEEGLTRHFQYRHSFCVANIFFAQTDREWRIFFLDIVIHRKQHPFSDQDIQKCWKSLSAQRNI